MRSVLLLGNSAEIRNLDGKSRLKNSKEIVLSKSAKKEKHMR